MDFWSGIIGALVGGLATLAATWLTGHQSRQASNRSNKELIAATALMMQDDFYHYQATLARAIDRCDWWHQGELLEQQTSISDRKLVWAALSHDAIVTVARGADCLLYLQSRSTDFDVPDTVTNTVADAQGWMDYLKGRRHVAGHGPATRSDIDVMKWTFALLDVARRALQTTASRPPTDFSRSHLFGAGGLVHAASVRDLLNRDCLAPQER